MPIDETDALIFQETPAITVATNTFIEVPIVLQYDETPLIEVVREQNAGYCTSIPIYHSDGTYLAKVVGTRLFSTAAGEKAGVVLHHPQDATVCELGARPYSSSAAPGQPRSKRKLS